LINTVFNADPKKNTPEECEKCFLKVACKKTSCVSANFSLYGDFEKMIKFNCEWDQMICAECITQMKILTEANCSTFKEYLLNLPFYENFFKQLKEKGE
jgi:hypothetical protein